MTDKTKFQDNAMLIDGRGLEGEGGFRLMPDDQFSIGKSSAEVNVEAGSWATTLSYLWVHPEDGEQHGFLLMSQPDEDELVQATFVDSWHQKPGLMNLVGTCVDNTTSLHATYMETWGWNISVSINEDRSVRMVMQNVVPEEAISMAPEGVEFQAGPYDVMCFHWRLEGE